MDEHKSQKTLGIHNWTQTGEGTYTRALCQKNEGSVEAKQRPVKMGGRTIHRTLSPKRTHFQSWIDRCLEEDESAAHVLCDCEAIAYLRFCHLGQFCMEPSDYYEAPINKVLHFFSNCRINEGVIKGEAQ
jgi:hypothetical protein